MGMKSAALRAVTFVTSLNWPTILLVKNSQNPFTEYPSGLTDPLS